MERSRLNLIVLDKPKIGDFISIFDKTQLIVAEKDYGKVLGIKKKYICDRTVYECRCEIYNISEIRENKIDQILNF